MEATNTPQSGSESGSIPKNLSKNILQRTLGILSHLDLSGKIDSSSILIKVHGGYCDVFIARYSVDGNNAHMKVAVKRLRVHIMDDIKLGKRLAKEIRVWSALEHPNILPLLGYMVEENGYPSLISEWMEDGTLLKYKKAHPSCDISEMILGIAEGVHYLHEKGIVHSDLKPDNVLVSPSAQPLVCDFGISRMLVVSQSFSQSSQTGGVRGTLRYMAPELLEHNDENVDPGNGQPQSSHSTESDVWAFGMTTLELLTEKPPFSNIATDVQVMLAIIFGELPLKPNDEKSLLGFWKLCIRCWEKEPTDRPPMTEIIVKINRILDKKKTKQKSRSQHGTARHSRRRSIDDVDEVGSDGLFDPFINSDTAEYDAYHSSQNNASNSGSDRAHTNYDAREVDSGYYGADTGQDASDDFYRADAGHDASEGDYYGADANGEAGYDGGPDAYDA